MQICSFFTEHFVFLFLFCGLKFKQDMTIQSLHSHTSTFLQVFSAQTLLKQRALKK